MTITLEVNGQSHVVKPGGRRLLAVLRDDLELLGTKLACGEGACGACAVLLDGKPVNSCLLLAEAAAGHEIVTIEGLSTGRAAAHPGGVRCRGRAAVRVLHTGPGRQRDGAARANPAADARADPRGDGRQPLPLRCLSEDRARDPARRRWRMTARFVRTQKEMEGRYEDVWALVDETDDVESWAPDAELHARRQAGPAPRRRACGRRPRALHGRRAARGDAARGRAALTGRPWPGALARPRGALAVPGVRAVIGPESELSLTTNGAPARGRARLRGTADRRRRR